MSQLKSGWRGALVGLLGWIMLVGLAPGPGAPRLVYALDLGVANDQSLTYIAAAIPAVERAADAREAVAGRGRRGADVALWRLKVGAGIVADSNVANASRDRFIPYLINGVATPVALDPALRSHSGAGRSISVASGVKLRLSDGVAIAVDGEGQAMDYKGGADDDISFLLAAGPELTWSSGATGSVQLVAAESWYGGTSLQGGLGLRAAYEMPVGDAQRFSFSLDARRFNSGYGRQFGGTEAGAALGYSRVIDPATTASLGLYARRDWLREDAYSGLELGAYAGVSRYLSDGITGSVSAGFSRTVYDAPLAYLSPERREEWRFSAGAQLTTRKPIGLGFRPTLSYSFNRSDSSMDFFDSTRHRVRIGVAREF